MNSPAVIVIGAGPYGLSAGAFLRKVGVEAHVVGDVMSFWQEDMPRGLKLRSPLGASEIGSQIGDLTLSRFAAATGAALVNPLPVETFIDYGKWFQQQAVVDVDGRRVTRVERGPTGFVVWFDDGETVATSRVIVAAGIHDFAWRPPEFQVLPPSLASHSADHSSFDRFAGSTVAVVGGGQSALESAALLHESGANVEVLIRRPEMRILIGGRLRPYLGRLSFLAYPPEDVGPPGLNLLTVRPNLFKRFPRTLQTKMARRAIRPAGASWLVPRLEPVTVSTAVSPVSAQARNGSIEIRLSDGSSRTADHVVCATGFRIDVRHYDFLHEDLIAGLELVDGYPVLNRAFESSVPGLHFVGAPAAWSFGPLMRFVSGTWFTTHALTSAIAGRSVASPRASRRALTAGQPLSGETA
jgi:Pyridine nucleotide-disulphide oxidoreductase